MPRWLCLFLAALTLHLVYTTDLEHLDTIGIIKAFGWRGEDHTVQTEDGYLLKLYRLLSPEVDNNSGCRPPVLMVSGLYFPVESLILLGPGKDLAFLLVDAGFDVWLGGMRGDTPGKGHVHLSKYDFTFSEYSWHEMGYYDVPALVDYILPRTRAQKLTYIGYSMGATSFYVMSSTRPEYNAKVQMLIGMAPVAFMAGPYSPFFRLIGQFSTVFYEIAKKIHLRELYSEPMRRMIQIIYRSGPAGRRFVEEGTNLIMARTTSKQFNSTTMPTILAHLTSTTPRTALHYFQNIHTGRFQRMDLGSKENLRLYNSIEPPDYNISSITVPAALYYSTNDALCFEVDVLKASKTLPNLIKVYKVPDKTFSHVDFLWGKDTYNLLYKDIIELMIERTSTIC